MTRNQNIKFDRYFMDYIPSVIKKKKKRKSVNQILEENEMALNDEETYKIANNLVHKSYTNDLEMQNGGTLVNENVFQDLEIFSGKF